MKATRFAHSARWLAKALAAPVLAAVLALASQLALAHGGHHHEPAAAPQAAGSGQSSAPSVAAGKVSSRSAAAAWSSSCPGGSGGDCCCKHQPSGPGPAKFAISRFGGWTQPAALRSERPAMLPAETLPQQPFASRALPRAPPFSS
jgi:hypothetical protein